jgi:hypothetical protein
VRDFDGCDLPCRGGGGAACRQTWREGVAAARMRWRAGGSRRITDATSRLEATACSLVVHNRRRRRAGRLESRDGMSSTWVMLVIIFFPKELHAGPDGRNLSQIVRSNHTCHVSGVVKGTIKVTFF